MIKITTASSSSVKPGDADLAAKRAVAEVRRGAGSGRHFIASSRRLAAVYIVRTFDAVRAERLQHVRIPVALIEVGRRPRIFGKALDVTAALVVGGHAAVGRRRYQRVQTLVGGGVV